MFSRMNEVVNDFYSTTPGIKKIETMQEIEIDITCTLKHTALIPLDTDIETYIDDIIDGLDLSDFEVDADWNIKGREMVYIK